MKSCKRWTSTGRCVCSVCRVSFDEPTAGVLCDIATDVEQTTIVKFICYRCAGPIVTAMVGPEVVRQLENQRLLSDLMSADLLGRGRR